MSDTKIIEELCGILRDLAAVVEGQQKALRQLQAVAMEEDYEAVKGRYAALLGREEWPDEVAEDIEA